MEPPKNKTALVAGVAVATIVTTAAVAMAVWPALTRPDPPAEATGDRGLRISLVEPPKALVARASPLDVGLSEVAQAMAKGREALFVRTPPVRVAPPPTPARRTPIQVAQVDEQEDLAPPPEPVDDRGDQGDWRRDRFEEVQRQRREDAERSARREREDRAAWEQAQRERERWEDARERDRYDDRYAQPPPPDDDRPPPGW